MSSVKDVYFDVYERLHSKYPVFFKKITYQLTYSDSTGEIVLDKYGNRTWGGMPEYDSFKRYPADKGADWIVSEIEKDLNLKEGTSMDASLKVTEAASKYLTTAKKIDKDAEYLLTIASQLVGAASGNEIDQMVSRALSAASNLIAFADYFLGDGTVSVDAVRGNYNKLLNAARNLKVAQQVKTEESTEVFVDPYESEYLPEELLSGNQKEIVESVNEDSDPLPDDLDDDPDAVFTLNPDGMPVKFNNTPIELDPFAVKLFRNNAEFIDPPEVFNAVSDASVSTEPAPEPGSASDVTVDDAERDQVIDVIADGSEEEKEDLSDVQLPPDDFDVFANESKIVVPAVKSKVTPKEMPVLPPQFSPTETLKANDTIAEAPLNNLRMLSFLTQDW